MRLGRPAQARDVQAELATTETPARPVAPGSVLPVGRVWRTMSERTLASWQTTPHFSLQREVNASRLLSWQALARARSGVRVTITDLLVRAVADALVRHPALNRSWSQAGLVEHPAIGIGLAVAVDDGLVVPVIHEADTRTLADIAARRADIVTRARGRNARAGRRPGWDLHDQQPRHVRRRRVHRDHQLAPGGDPRDRAHRRPRAPARGRPCRAACDDDHALVRPPRHSTERAPARSCRRSARRSRSPRA